MWSDLDEFEFRETLISWVIDLANQGDGTLSRAELESINYHGRNIRLIDARGGIWNPGQSWPFPEKLRATLSINTTLNSTYKDAETSGGLWRYDYQVGGTGGKNTKMRAAIEFKLPVLWFKQIESERYIPYRVFIVEDFPEELYCLLAPEQFLDLASRSSSELERRYAMKEMKRRLHQPAFRSRVLDAYEVKCSVCRLAHGKLLDAAHIIPDSQADGSAVVTNGLALCKIHHAAYDFNFIGINSEYIVHVRRDILEEEDGPMLKHGIVEMHGRTAWVPRREQLKPDKDRLGKRFDEFRSFTPN